jgi:NitT/TauT family transport system substrate-binding protein
VSRPMWVRAGVLVGVAVLGISACSSKKTAAPSAGSSTGGAASQSSSGASTPASATAATGATASIKVMVGGLSKQIYLPFMLAKQLGYYDQQGLNVTLLDEPAGVDAETAMLAGQVDGVGGFYDHNIALQGKGKSTEAVVSMLLTPGEVELCRTDLKGTINSPADWKGRHLGITDLGSSTDFLTQYLATKNGVAVTDIHELGVQAGTTLIAAMEHKQVDCAMTTEPTVSALLQKKDAYIILDMRTAAGAKAALGGEYPATSLYMQTSFVTAHKDTVQKLVNAYVETLQWIQSHTADQITAKMPADYYAGTGRDAYVAALSSEKGIYNPTGVMPADGPPVCLNVLAANPAVKGKTIDLSKTYTDEFVKQALSTLPSPVGS